MEEGLKILFVCTGNTCRSSMAEGIARDQIRKTNFGGKRIKKVKIMSAGTGAFAGSPASPLAVQVLSKQGIDLSGHKSKRISRELLEKADYIFTMTMIQKQQVLFVYPEAADKTYTLLEFIYAKTGNCHNHDLNISDPYGYDITCYEACANQLKEAIEKMLEQVLQ